MIGDDMFYGQYLFNDGNAMGRLLLLAVPKFAAVEWLLTIWGLLKKGFNASYERQSCVACYDENVTLLSYLLRRGDASKVELLSVRWRNTK